MAEANENPSIANELPWVANENPSIQSLQYTVAVMRNLYPERIKKTLVDIAKLQVQELEETQCTTTTYNDLVLPDIKDPFEDYEIPNRKDDDDKFIEELVNQSKMLAILLRKKQCPISQIVDGI